MAMANSWLASHMSLSWWLTIAHVTSLLTYFLGLQNFCADDIVHCNWRSDFFLLIFQQHYLKKSLTPFWCSLVFFYWVYLFLSHILIYLKSFYNWTFRKFLIQLVFLYHLDPDGKKTKMWFGGKESPDSPGGFFFFFFRLEWLESCLSWVQAQIIKSLTRARCTCSLTFTVRLQFDSFESCWKKGVRWC